MSWKNMKILIVEDNIILCGMIEKWLQKAGYEVLAAIDEPGARNILKKTKSILYWETYACRKVTVSAFWNG